jgi:hypothetical protein
MRNALLATLLALSLFACSHAKPAPTHDAAGAHHDADEPQAVDGGSLFAKFPVTAEFKGAPAKLNFAAASTHARKYEKELAALAAKGPNFAGNVTLALVKCGAACQEIFIISAKTGKILPNTLSADAGADFRRDSALLIVHAAKKSPKKLLQWEAKGGFSPVEAPFAGEALEDPTPDIVDVMAE